jgi:hypothetical protein
MEICFQMTHEVPRAIHFIVSFHLLGGSPRNECETNLKRIGSALACRPFPRKYLIAFILRIDMVPDWNGFGRAAKREVFDRQK